MRMSRLNHQGKDVKSNPDYHVQHHYAVVQSTLVLRLAGDKASNQARYMLMRRVDRRSPCDSYNRVCVGGVAIRV
jgi:hypothetical protein